MTDKYAYFENDLEGQLQTKPWAGHLVTLGGNLRWTHINTENGTNTNETYTVHSGYDEYWAGAYMVDRFDLTERMTLESQGRIDRYSKTTTDWSVRFAGLVWTGC